MFFHTAMSDDHSELAPPLPIPNRAVKRLSADDSADSPCESRTSSGTHNGNAPADRLGRFCLYSAHVPYQRAHNRSRWLTAAIEVR